MKCEDFFENLESNFPWRRFFARQHARHCATCAASQEALVKLKAELAQAEPLMADQRRRWEAAVQSTATIPTFDLVRWQWGLITAAVLLVAVSATAYYTANQRQPAGPGHARRAAAEPVVSVAQIDHRPELLRLKEQLNDLETQLDQLSGQAELIDAREQVIALIQTSNQW